MTEIAILFVSACIAYIIWDITSKIIMPKIVYKSMKETERNPKWITSELQYYGFDDIDIVLYESNWITRPCFRLGKDNKLELWISDDTSPRDATDVGRLALCGKVKAMYGLWFPDKPIYWLSVLLYMLDGGDITVKNKKPLD